MYVVILLIKTIFSYTLVVMTHERLCSVKIESSPVLWTCEIQGAQYMISIKKLRFSSHSRTKVRRQGPPGSARAQPWSWATQYMLQPYYHLFSRDFNFVNLE